MCCLAIEIKRVVSVGGFVVVIVFSQIQPKTKQHTTAKLN